MFLDWDSNPSLSSPHPSAISPTPSRLMLAATVCLIVGTSYFIVIVNNNFLTGNRSSIRQKSSPYLGLQRVHHHDLCTWC